MTPLEHTDELSKSPPGTWLVATSPFRSVNLQEGGTHSYVTGDRFRVSSSDTHQTYVEDEDSNRTSIPKALLLHLKVDPSRPQPKKTKENKSKKINGMIYSIREPVGLFYLLFISGMGLAAGAGTFIAFVKVMNYLGSLLF